MFAFVAATAPLARTTFSGSAVCSAPASPLATVSMSMSKSVPFLETPPKTVGLPGSAEFDPLMLSNYVDIKFLQEAELKYDFLPFRFLYHGAFLRAVPA